MPSNVSQEFFMKKTLANGLPYALFGRAKNGEISQISDVVTGVGQDVIMDVPEKTGLAFLMGPVEPPTLVRLPGQLRLPPRRLCHISLKTG